MPIAQMPMDPTINDSHIDRFLKSHLCAHCPYECRAKLKFEKFKWEIHYIMKVFHATYRKFLTAIDHIDYHPTQIQNNKTRITSISQSLFSRISSGMNFLLIMSATPPPALL